MSEGFSLRVEEHGTYCLTFNFTFRLECRVMPCPTRQFLIGASTTLDRDSRGIVDDYLATALMKVNVVATSEDGEREILWSQVGDACMSRTTTVGGDHTCKLSAGCQLSTEFQAVPCSCSACTVQDKKESPVVKVLTSGAYVVN